LIDRMSWKRKFGDPIVLPNGRQLVTLQDAGTYITKLPKSEHEAPEWQHKRQERAEAWQERCRPGP
jgi:hypothetical protein